MKKIVYITHRGVVSELDLVPLIGENNCPSVREFLNDANREDTHSYFRTEEGFEIKIINSWDIFNNDSFLKMDVDEYDVVFVDISNDPPQQLPFDIRKFLNSLTKIQNIPVYLLAWNTEYNYNMNDEVLNPEIISIVSNNDNIKIVDGLYFQEDTINSLLLPLMYMCRHTSDYALTYMGAKEYFQIVNKPYRFGFNPGRLTNIRKKFLHKIIDSDIINHYKFHFSHNSYSNIDVSDIPDNIIKNNVTRSFLPIKNKRVSHLYMQNESIFNAHLLSDVIIYNDSYASRPLNEILFTEKTFQMLMLGKPIIPLDKNIYLAIKKMGFNIVSDIDERIYDEFEYENRFNYIISFLKEKLNISETEYLIWKQEQYKIAKENSDRLETIYKDGLLKELNIYKQ
jgi:hypothetical protein